MINRVLIRIKVVQLLYSYLLSGHNFSLEAAPESPTRGKRFAYGLYLDTLYLILRISEEIEKRGGDKPLLRNRLVRILSCDDRLRSHGVKVQSSGFNIAPALASITEAVKSSAIYKKYTKLEETSLAEDVRFWQEVFDLIILCNPEYNAVISGMDGYSLRGVEWMKGFMEDTFKKVLSSQIPLSDARKQLAASMDKARELYIRLLALPIELTRLRDRQIDSNRHKLLPDEGDLNPNMKFVENRLVAALEGNSALMSEIERRKLSWTKEDPVLMRDLLAEVMESEIYKEYMADPECTMRGDADLWRSLLRNVIFCSPTFLEALEDKSIFWNDDLEIISTFVQKSFRLMEDGGGNEAFLPMYKDDEDARFGDQLFEFVARNKSDYRLLLDECIRKDTWDIDRLAYMDTVIILTAIAEILNFPKIPVKVSINEYIEMAKSYSTSKSGVFVNGLLGSIVSRLEEKGEIQKTL